MTVSGLYRLSLCLPLLVPTVVIATVRGSSVQIPAGPFAALYQLMAGSLLYGGVPYAFLALWALWWTRSRSAIP